MGCGNSRTQKEEHKKFNDIIMFDSNNVKNKSIVNNNESNELDEFNQANDVITKINTDLDNYKNEYFSKNNTIENNFKLNKNELIKTKTNNNESTRLPNSKFISNNSLLDSENINKNNLNDYQIENISKFASKQICLSKTNTIDNLKNDRYSQLKTLKNVYLLKEAYEIIKQKKLIIYDYLEPSSQKLKEFLNDIFKSFSFTTEELDTITKVIKKSDDIDNKKNLGFIDLSNKLFFKGKNKIFKFIFNIFKYSCIYSIDALCLIIDEEFISNETLCKLLFSFISKNWKLKSLFFILNIKEKDMQNGINKLKSLELKNKVEIFLSKLTDSLLELGIDVKYNNINSTNDNNKLGSISNVSNKIKHNNNLKNFCMFIKNYTIKENSLLNKLSDFVLKSSLNTIVLEGSEYKSLNYLNFIKNISNNKFVKLFALKKLKNSVDIVIAALYILKASKSLELISFDIDTNANKNEDFYIKAKNKIKSVDLIVSKSFNKLKNRIIKL